MPSKKTKRLSDTEVIKKARRLLEHGFTHHTNHFKEELADANATTLDVDNLINGECRVVKTESSRKHQAWKYTIEGYNEDGEMLTVVVSIDVERSILRMITAF